MSHLPIDSRTLVETWFRLAACLLGAVLAAVLICAVSLMPAHGATRESSGVEGATVEGRDAAPPAGLMLRPQDGSGAEVPAPVVDTHVAIAITGITAGVTVRQSFTNPGDGWVEGVYVFPLPDDAAVDALNLRIGERMIEGRIREREEAKQAYEQAARSGRRASLVEQERPNIFTTSVANIGPGETVSVDLHYRQPVDFDEERFSLRFPTVVGPRYVPKEGLVASADGTGWVPNPEVPSTEVPNADRIAPPVRRPQAPGANPVAFAITLDAGIPLDSVDTPFHAARIAADETGRYTIRLDSVPADRDFLLTWYPAASEQPQPALFAERRPDGIYLTAMVVPPTLTPRDLPATDREVIFILDVSGSMAGDSIEQARAALALAIDRLEPAARFNIVAFNDKAWQLFDGAQRATPEAKRRATGFLLTLEADGGTEIGSALDLALDGQVRADRLRQIVFLTDAAVGNETSLLSKINRDLGDSRLFTVGIGSAPNTWFMRKAAETGRGDFTFIGKLSEVGDRMGALFEKLESPALTDIVAVYPDSAGTEAFPKTVPDLYSGGPVAVTAKVPALTGALELSGLIGRSDWRASLPLAEATMGSGIAAHWARRKIEALTDMAYEGVAEPEIRQAVLPVALEHSLMSRYTSLVAIDATPIRPADEAMDSRPVETELPAGWEYDKVFGPEGKVRGPAPAGLQRAAAPAPGVAIAANGGMQSPFGAQGATPAQLQILLGALLCLAGLGLFWVRRRMR